jgi:hypothetical protein
MGTYATFEFKKPLYCPYCAEKHTSIQCSDGEMEHYKVGDVCDIFSPNYILELRYYCLNEICDSAMLDILGYEYEKFFYIVIKDGIYIGVTSSLRHAEYLGDFWSEKEYEFYN